MQNGRQKENFVMTPSIVILAVLVIPNKGGILKSGNEKAVSGKRLALNE
jgi:hypothetical protein